MVRQARQYPDCAATTYLHLEACSAEAGYSDETKSTLVKALQLEPTVSVSTVRNALVGINEVIFKSTIDSLR